MIIKELLNRLNETELEIEKTWEHYRKLCGDSNEMRDELCKNINFEDLRPMQKKDIVVGQRIFGKNNEGFYILVVEEVLGYGDLDFKAFISDGSEFGIYHHYVLKGSL